jgi:AFG3 family protein
VRGGDEYVDEHHFESAVERVIGGLEKKPQNYEETKKTVSIHECGHAIVSWFLEGGSPLIKVG